MIDADAGDASAADVQWLLDLSDQEFEELVSARLARPRFPRLWMDLLSPSVVRRTHDYLSGRFRDIEDQLASRNAELNSYRAECFRRGQDGKDDWFTAKGEHDEWRESAIRYRRIVGARLTEAKAALRGPDIPRPAPTPPDPAKRRHHKEVIFKLAWAIDRHRRQTLAAGISPDEHDVALWRSLDEVQTSTNAGNITVAEYLADITSKSDFIPPEDRV